MYSWFFCLFVKTAEPDQSLVRLQQEKIRYDNKIRQQQRLLQLKWARSGCLSLVSYIYIH